MVKRLAVLWLLLCLPTWAQPLGNDRVSSRMSHQQIGMDETATLSITVKGLNDVMDLSTPQAQPDGLQIIPIGRQFSMTSVNGSTQTSTEFNYLITPLAQGRFLINPVTVNVNGVDYQTSSHRLEVTGALSRSQPTTPPTSPWSNPRYNPGILTNPWEPTPPRRPRGEDVILEADLEPDTVYLHEAAIYNLRLLAAVRIGDARYNPVSPTGLVSVPFPQEDSEETRQGRRYSVSEAKIAFFALTEGEFDFPASQIQTRAGLFGRTRVLETEPKKLRVLGLPTEGQPLSFTGAVGEAFEMEAALSRSQVKAGKTVELKVKVRGNGHLGLVPKPHIPGWSEIEVKQTDSPTKTDVVNQELRSEREYVFRVKAKKPGVYKLDDIAFAYFRPSVERYEILKAPDLTLYVEEGEVAADQTQSDDPAALPEADRPAAKAGPSQEKVKHLSLRSFGLSGLLGLLGLVLIVSGSKLARPTLSGFSGGFSKTPKTLEELQSALSVLAPGSDSLSRATELERRGWSPDRIKSFEALKDQVSARLYGANQVDDGAIQDLLKSFRSLRKGGKI